MRRAVLLLVVAVLLLGTAVLVAPEWTLASWQDDERGSAEFTAGTFQSQSQTSGNTDWATHPAGSPAVLAVDGLTGLAPGGTRDAPTAGTSALYWINLRTAPGSHWGGRVALTAPESSGALAAALEYRMVPRTASTAPCTAADMAASNGWWQPADQPISGDLGLRVAADGGSAVGLCVEIRVAASAAGAAGSVYQGASADLRWDFTLVQD